MSVFEIYFAIKYGLKSLSRLSPVRMFEHEGQLWSVDNRRLLEMRLEDPYIQHQSPTRFQELLK